MSEAAREALQRRQLELVARSALLRDRLGAELAPWMPTLRRVDAGIDAGQRAWQWLRAHPEGPIAASLVLVAIRPRRAWRWGLKLWSAWRVWRRLAPPPR